MGRGRGKGKKLTVVAHEDPGSSGDEVLPTYRRRGRPQKILKDEMDEDDAQRMNEEENGEDLKPNRELKGSLIENGKKRRKNSQVKENSDSALVENGATLQPNNDESTKSHGFRHNGSRRKSKPRRAAEAGVECK